MLRVVAFVKVSGSGLTSLYDDPALLPDYKLWAYMQGTAKADSAALPARPGQGTLTSDQKAQARPGKANQRPQSKGRQNQETDPPLVEGAGNRKAGVRSAPAVGRQHSKATKGRGNQQTGMHSSEGGGKSQARAEPGPADRRKNNKAKVTADKKLPAVRQRKHSQQPGTGLMALKAVSGRR